MLYTLVIGLGEEVVEITTPSGVLNWKIDKLTSQKHLLGTYEPYMQEAFLKMVRPGFVVYDVGSHAAYHSLFCGLLVGKAGRVVAFEPNPENHASIERQISVNPQLPVSVSHYALSDHCATLRLDTSKGSSQGFVSDRGTISIEARTIDFLVCEGQLPPPDLIKIDVEGHEEQVLRGALETVRKHKPIILCDYNDHTTFSMVSDLLGPFSYQVSSGPPVIAIHQATE